MKLNSTLQSRIFLQIRLILKAKIFRMILIFFFFVQNTPLLNTVYPWVFFSHVTKVREMCIFFSLCQSIFLRFKTFLIANNTVNHRKITRYTVFINMIMMVRYMQMFYLVGTSTIANSACLCHQHR